MKQRCSFVKFDENGQQTHDYKSLADSITTLPTLRSNIVDLVQSVEDSCETNIPDFVDKVRKDQSLVAQILKVARASKYARMIQVDTISDAIQVLGVQKLRDIAITQSFLGNFLKPNPYANGFDWKAFWKHAHTVGVISSIIAKKLGKSDHERFYTAGLLHDLGKMGAFAVDEKSMLGVAEFARKQGISMIEAENNLLTPKHDLLGEAISEIWDLPKYITKVCRYHHTYHREQRAPKERAFLDDEQNEHIDIVILANYLAKKLKQGYSGHSVIEEPVSLILNNLILPEIFLEEITPPILAELQQGSFLDDMLNVA